MKIRLVFDDWRKDGRSVYMTGKGIELSNEDFHSGTTFHGEIVLSSEQQKQLEKAFHGGYRPVFWIDKESILQDHIEQFYKKELKVYDSESRQIMTQICTILDDCIVIYASECCSEEQCAEAGKRILDAGGVLAYLANGKKLIKKMMHNRLT